MLMNILQRKLYVKIKKTNEKYVGQIKGIKIKSLNLIRFK